MVELLRMLFQIHLFLDQFLGVGVRTCSLLQMAVRLVLIANLMAICH